MAEMFPSCSIEKKNKAYLGQYHLCIQQRNPLHFLSRLGFYYGLGIEAN